MDNEVANEVEPADAGIEVTISTVLRLGVAVAMVLVAAGVAIGVFSGPLGQGSSDATDVLMRDPDQHHGIAELWRSLRGGHASGVIAAGVFVLVLTPLVRVAASAVAYVRARDTAFALLTFAVLAMLTASLAFGVAA